MPWYCMNCDCEVEYARRRTYATVEVTVDYDVPESEVDDPNPDGDWHIAGDIDLCSAEIENNHVAWICVDCEYSEPVWHDVFAWRDEEDRAGADTAPENQSRFERERDERLRAKGIRP